MRNRQPFAVLGVFALSVSFCLRAETSPFSHESAAYNTLGIVVSQNLRLNQLGLSDAQFDAFIAGLRQARSNQPPAPLTPESEAILDQIRGRVTQLQQAPASPAPDDRLRKYLQSVREQLELQINDSGLLHRILQGGVGPRPRAVDTVIIDIEAKTPDLKTDIPQLSRQDTRIKVSDLLPGIAEGVQMLTLGGRQLLVVPPHLSFGNNPWPAGIEPGMPLVFQITLKDIVTATERPR